MQLHEFVKDAIVQIVQGVQAAKEELKDIDVLINPVLGSDLSRTGDSGLRAVQQLEINVAVSVEGKEGSKQGIGVMAGLFSAGAAGSQEATNKTVSTLKFSVPISLPYDGAVRQPASINQIRGAFG